MIDYPIEKQLIIARLAQSGYQYLADTARKLFNVKESTQDCIHLAHALSELMETDDTADSQDACSTRTLAYSGIFDISTGPDGEPYILLPEELTKQLGWDEGTQLTWRDNGDGSFSLRKRGC